ncbi:MAG: hypothetical protein JSV88_30420 [Candidatus Aminicenantes bacterium]|nr:MAG: hypothetical protein JSV88_30420 [Candidatus Aminicenantes bacterium]
MTHEHGTMNVIHIIVIVEAIILIALIGVTYHLYIKTNHRIANIGKNMQHLSTISKQFLEFIEKSERVGTDISEELTLRQNVLNKLISEAEKVSQQLGMMEKKFKENKLDKETVDKILILVNQGFTPTEIAPKLNIPLGEIELVIKLRRYLSSPLKEKL